MSKPRKKSKKILFILEIVVLLLFIGGLFVYGQISAKLDKIDIQETDLADQDIVTNDQAPQMTGYTTYALFGLDHRSKNEKLNTENSDTIIIASINNDTKAVKLVSVYRDTLLNVKDDTYSKANSAYAFGGPTNAVSMLNTNLDLNITDYVAIDFNALVTVVDCLGGLDIPLSYAEIVHMNNYCVETSEETGKTGTFFRPCSAKSEHILSAKPQVLRQDIKIAPPCRCVPISNLHDSCRWVFCLIPLRFQHPCIPGRPAAQHQNFPKSRTKNVG